MADFAEVAKEYSTEPVAKETGGDYGWFGSGKMVPEFRRCRLSLGVNEISEPVKTTSVSMLSKYLKRVKLKMKGNR